MTTAEGAPPGTMVSALRQELERQWPPEGDPMHDLARYALLPPGKLVRPRLLVEAARAVGGAPDTLLAAALSVEYLHVGSLVHDDLIDGDDLRRGRSSVPARYGSADAVVGGDALMLRSMAELAAHATDDVPASAVLEATRLLAEAGIDLCRGQALESRLLGDVRCGLARYRTMIGLKTGALFRVSCEIGAILGGGSPGQARALNRFGHHLGLAFQMRDDLLGYLDGEAAGKPPTSDVANHRPTLPVLVGFRAAGARDRLRFEQALSGALSTSDSHQLLRELFDATGAVAFAEQEAAREVRLAKSCLAGLPVAESVATLSAFADSAAQRRC